MPVVRSNGIELHYEATGDPADPVLLLIMGLGEQLIQWPDGFCAALAGHGFRVIRFDNRDVGRSTWLDDLGVPDLPALFSGDLSSVRYHVADMVADTRGLLDALGVERAHLAGVSMGGMIAQQLTIDSPGRVASLASLMASSGDRVTGLNTLENPGALAPAPDADRESAIAAEVGLYRMIGSPAYATSDEELAQRAAAKYDRGYHPAGTLRQFGAVAAAPDRTAGLRTVRTPTVVIHGEADRMVGVSGGRTVAGAVPDAELITIAGMGHDLPRGLWDRIAGAIAANAARA